MVPETFVQHVTDLVEMSVRLCILCQLPKPSFAPQTNKVLSIARAPPLGVVDHKCSILAPMRGGGHDTRQFTKGRTEFSV